MKNKIGAAGTIFAIVLAILSAGITWGTMSSRVNAAERQIEEIKTSDSNFQKTVLEELGSIQNDTTEIRTKLEMHMEEENK